MEVVKNVNIRRRGKLNYDKLVEQVKRIVGQQKDWAVKVEEAELLNLINARRESNVGKLSLARQVGKRLSKELSRKVECAYTRADKCFYIWS